MKAAIFADLHIGLKQDSADWHSIALEWADWFSAELKKRYIKTIFFLGDFFHNRNTVSVITLYTASIFLQKLKDFDIHIIYGNHDLFYKNNPEVTGVALFDGFDNIHLYPRPEVVEMGGKKLVFCGWGYNPLDYKGDVLLTHAEVDMFQFNDTITAQTELKPSALLTNYKKVISGHFHGRQIKSWKKGSIEYIGNPFQMDFSDADIDKVFGIIDLDDLSMEYVENNISPIFIENKLSEIIDYADLNRFVKLLEGNFFKLVVDKDITVLDLNELKRLFAACNVRDAKFNLVTKQDFDVTKNDVKSFSIMDSISEYIDSIEVDNKSEIKSYILEIYNKYSI